MLRLGRLCSNETDKCISSTEQPQASGNVLRFWKSIVECSWNALSEENARNLKCLISFPFQLYLHFRQKLHHSLLLAGLQELGILFLRGVYESIEGIYFFLRDTVYRVKSSFSPEAQPEFFYTGFGYVPNISNCLF